MLDNVVETSLGSDFLLQTCRMNIRVAENTGDGAKIGLSKTTIYVNVYRSFKLESRQEINDDGE